jgi:hypothetical protein
MIIDANKFAEAKREEMVKTVFLADKYLAELKVYYGIENHEYTKDQLIHLGSTAHKLVRVIDFIQKHQAQLHRTSVAPSAPRLVAVKSYA